MNKEFADIFYRPIVFQEIERTVWPPSWLGHAPFALWLMESLKPQTVVELGTHSGNSFAAFCQGAKFLNYSPSCYAVDTWLGDPHAGLYGEEVFEEVSHFFRKTYGHFTYLIRSTFNDALKNFADGSIDLLNIDGYHTYEATKENFEAWISKMSSKGIVLIHDTNVRTADFKAWKYWEEIQDKYPSFTFLHSHGLGVIAAGTELSTGLKYLMDLKSAQTEEIQKFFAHLGSIPILKSTNQKLATESELRKEIEAGIEDLPTSFDESTESKNPLLGNLNQQARKIKALISELESLGSLYEENLRWKGYVENNLGETFEEVDKYLELQRMWKQFVIDHLAPTLDEALIKLTALGDSNLEGIKYKTFVHCHLAENLDEALKKLTAVGDSNLEGIQYKTFVHTHLAKNLDEALKKLTAVGDSNLEGIKYKLFVQGNLAETAEEALTKLKALGEMNLEGIAYKLLVQKHFGDNLEESTKKLEELISVNKDYLRWRQLMKERLGNSFDSNKKFDELLAEYQQVQSVGHKTISFVSNKITSILR